MLHRAEISAARETCFVAFLFFWQAVVHAAAVHRFTERYEYVSVACSR